jgi:hypothetical protein
VASRQDLEQLVAGATKLETAIRTHFIPDLPDLKVSELAQNVSQLVAHFILERQTEALRAAVTLARQSLGHLALPMVRPACEERIWAAYLYALDEAPRTRLLLLMSALESSGAVSAQQQFLGTKTMRRLGFPKSFVRELSMTRKSHEAELAVVGQGLGWPEDTRGVPSVGWVASQTKLDSLYSFLYSATSKGVHFSPSEAARSGWSSSLESDSPVILMAEPYRLYRTAFSLHWLCTLLIETAIVVASHGPLGESELEDEASRDVLEAAELIGSAGRVPIVLASEFNLSQPKDPS